MKCPNCSAEFEPRSVPIFGKQYFTQKRCDFCIEETSARERLEREQAEAEAIAARKAEQWSKICPLDYRAIDLKKLPARAQQSLPQILSWRYNPIGLLVGGETGAGKTRCVYRLLKQVFDCGLTIEAHSPLSFRASVVKAAMGGGGLEDWVYRASKADVFYFDDLGQMRLTESSEEALFELVERRCANQKPILATTQYQNEIFVAQFIRPERGSAIARRLMEFCEFIEL